MMQPPRSRPEESRPEEREDWSLKRNQFLVKRLCGACIRNTETLTHFFGAFPLKRRGRRIFFRRGWNHQLVIQVVSQVISKSNVAFTGPKFNIALEKEPILRGNMGYVKFHGCESHICLILLNPEMDDWSSFSNLRIMNFMESCHVFFGMCSSLLL